MRVRVALTVVVLAFVVGAVPSSAQTEVPQAGDAAFRKDVEKLLDLTGSSQMGIQMASLVSAQFLDGLKKSNPEVPARAFDLAKELLNEEFTKAFGSPDGLTPQLVTIYAKHFTHQDVLGLIAFYETDLGRKTIRTMPQLIQEGAAVGQAWAEQNVPRILTAITERLRADGLIK